MAAVGGGALMFMFGVLSELKKIREILEDLQGRESFKDISTPIDYDAIEEIRP